MVKLTGPGLGTAASGTLAKQLIFSNWKGRPYLKMHATPDQPNTLPQQAMKVIMAFLSAEWQNLSAGAQATWDEIAEHGDISPFNAYQQTNLARWRNFQPPGIVYPVTDSGVHPTVVNWGRDCLGNHALLKLQVTNQNDGWGVAYFRCDGGQALDSWNQLVGIRHMCGFCWNNFDWYPDEPGTYELGVWPFTTHGDWAWSAVIKHLGFCVLTT